jgi:gamma-glutamyl-gamma-aminobutyrate hydrolase PuuD
VEVLQKTTTFRRLNLSPSSGGWGRVDLIWARQKELAPITVPVIGLRKDQFEELLGCNDVTVLSGGSDPRLYNEDPRPAELQLRESLEMAVEDN